MTPVTVFKCLSDETRLRCIALLRKQGKLCVCELTYALEHLQPKVSRHLALLRQAGLLVDSREGQWVYYQINPQLPEWVITLIDTAVTEAWTEQHHSIDSQRLKSISNRVDFEGCIK